MNPFTINERLRTFFGVGLPQFQPKTPDFKCEHENKKLQSRVVADNEFHVDSFYATDKANAGVMSLQDLCKDRWRYIRPSFTLGRA